MGELCKGIDFILGPTGVGKNRLALAVATQHNAAVVNCDSVQFYDGVTIGANKPTAEEFDLCPHYLFGHVDVGNSATAADYARAAISLLHKASEQHFYFVGGSGFYVQALEKGMYQVPNPDPDILKKISDWSAAGGAELLYLHLQKMDAVSAKRIHPNDHYRIERALQINLMTGRTVGEFIEAKAASTDSPLKDYRVRKIALFLDKPELMSRLDDRAQSMVRNGLIEETENLLKIAGPDWPPLSSIGYLETRQHLSGHIAKSELSALIAANTMKLVKKQMTWFKRDQTIVWFHAVTDFKKAQEYLYKNT